MKLIHNWIELAEVEPSETHELVIDWVGDIRATGWIIDKVTGTAVYYLSSHLFYGSNYRRSTRLLQKYGFEIELDNWDKDDDNQ